MGGLFDAVPGVVRICVSLTLSRSSICYSPSLYSDALISTPDKISKRVSLAVSGVVRICVSLILSKSSISYSPSLYSDAFISTLDKISIIGCVLNSWGSYCAQFLIAVVVAEF